MAAIVEAGVDVGVLANLVLRDAEELAAEPSRSVGLDPFEGVFYAVAHRLFESDAPTPQSLFGDVRDLPVVFVLDVDNDFDFLIAAHAADVLMEDDLGCFQLVSCAL